MAEDPLAVAQRIADEVLFPAANAVDRADALPASHFDALADAGFYGLFVPPELGGIGLHPPDMFTAIETLAGGCVATAFVWIQHFGLLGSLLGDPGGELGRRWLGPAVGGEIKGGLALAGNQPGPPLLRADRTADGWRINGSSRWVTGWGLVDLLQVLARTGDADDRLVTLLIDATDHPGLTVTRQHLVAVDASRTVQLDFDNVAVPAERFVAETPFDPAGYLGTERLSLNGFMSLGLASRCCRLIGPSALDDEVAACRTQLITAEGDPVFAARAAASELALRAAAALAVHTGSGSILAGEHAARLMREAHFLLVFGSRPGIRAALLDRLGLSVAQE